MALSGYRTYRISHFAGGWNKKLPAIHPDFPENDWADGQNMTVTPGGIVEPRKGIAKLTELPSDVFGDGYRGLFRMYKADGTKILIAAGGDKLYRIDSNTSHTQLSTSTTLSSGQRTRFAQWHDVLFMVNGSDGVFVWDGNNSHEVTRLNVDAPTDPPTLGVEAGGSLADGTYHYKYTYYNSIYGIEGNPSPAPLVGATCGSGNNSVRVTIPSTTADTSSFDKVRIYRTDADAGAAGPYYRVAELDYSGSATDWVDTGQALGTQLDWDDHTMPGYGSSDSFKHVAVGKARVWLAGEAQAPYRLYYSKPDEPYYFPTANILDVYPEKGGAITGLAWLGDDLIVLTSSAIYRLVNAETPHMAYLRLVTDAIGNIAEDGVAVTDGLVTFVWHDGIYGYDGSRVVELSKDIRPLFTDELATFAKQHAVTTIWDRRLLVSYPSTDAVVSGEARRRITEYNADDGTSVKTATSSGTIAKLYLTNTPMSTRQEVRVYTYIHWPVDELRGQIVEFPVVYSLAPINTSHPDGDWSKAIVYTVQPADNVEALQFRMTHVIGGWDNFTGVALKLLPVGPWNDYYVADRVDLDAVSYYIQDSNTEARQDSCIAFRLYDGKWDVPYTNFNAAAWCVQNGPGDENELLFGASDNSWLNQAFVGDRDYDEPVVASILTKEFMVAPPGHAAFVDAVEAVLLPAVGSFWLVAMLDHAEVHRQRFSIQENQNFWAEVDWAVRPWSMLPNVSIKRMMLPPWRAEGRWIQFEVIAMAGTPLIVTGLEWRAKILEAEKWQF